MRRAGDFGDGEAEREVSVDSVALEFGDEGTSSIEGDPGHGTAGRPSISIRKDRRSESSIDGCVVGSFITPASERAGAGGRASRCARAARCALRAARGGRCGRGLQQDAPCVDERCKLGGAVLESRRDQERSSVSRNDRSCCNNLETSPAVIGNVAD